MVQNKPSDALTKPSRRGRIAAIGAAGLLLLSGIGVGGYALAQNLNQPIAEVAIAEEPTVDPNVSPIASFSFLTVDGLTIAVDGSNSIDPDGEITDYLWDFGNGQTGSGASASHAYADYGTYTVKLTVTDDAGAEGSFSAPVTFTAPPPPPVPEPPVDNGPVYGSYPPGYPVPTSPGTDSLDASACASKTAVETSNGPVCA